MEFKPPKIDPNQLKEGLERYFETTLNPEYQIITAEPEEQETRWFSPGLIIEKPMNPGEYILITSISNNKLYYITIFSSGSFTLKTETISIEDALDPDSDFQGKIADFSNLPLKAQRNEKLQRKYLESLVRRAQMLPPKMWKELTEEEQRNWRQKIKNENKQVPKINETWILEVISTKREGETITKTREVKKVKIKEVSPLKIVVAVISPETNQEGKKEIYSPLEFLIKFRPEIAEMQTEPAREATLTAEPAEVQQEEAAKPVPAEEQELPATPENEEEIAIEPADVFQEGNKYYIVLAKSVDNQQIEILIIDLKEDRTFQIETKTYDRSVEEGVEEFDEFLNKLRLLPPPEKRNRNFWEAIPKPIRTNNDVRNNFLRALINRLVAEERKEEFQDKLKIGEKWQRKGEPETIVIIKQISPNQIKIEGEDKGIPTEQFLQEFEPSQAETTPSAPVAEVEQEATTELTDQKRARLETIVAVLVPEGLKETYLDNLAAGKRWRQKSEPTVEVTIKDITEQNEKFWVLIVDSPARKLDEFIEVYEPVNISQEEKQTLEEQERNANPQVEPQTFPAEQSPEQPGTKPLQIINLSKIKDRIELIDPAFLGALKPGDIIFIITNKESNEDFSGNYGIITAVSEQAITYRPIHSDENLNPLPNEQTNEEIKIRQEQITQSPTEIKENQMLLYQFKFNENK